MGQKNLEGTPCLLATVKNRIQYFINKVKVIFIPAPYSLKNAGVLKRATNRNGSLSKRLTAALFTVIPTEDGRPFFILLYHSTWFGRRFRMRNGRLKEDWDFSVSPLRVSMGF
jgi:hypothetical protein